MGGGSKPACAIKAFLWAPGSASRPSTSKSKRGTFKTPTLAMHWGRCSGAANSKNRVYCADGTLNIGVDYLAAWACRFFDLPRLYGAASLLGRFPTVHGRQI